MKISIKPFTFFLFLFSILTCQKVDRKIVTNTMSTINSHNELYIGTWLKIEKENNSYLYCTDSDRSVKIDDKKILDHSPMEDSKFEIDHIVTKGEKTIFYINKDESSYYIVKWIDKEKKIISCQLNTYPPFLFINEKNINTLENKKCKPQYPSCDLHDNLKNFNFKLEAADFSYSEEGKNPISAWIIITRRSTSKSQEIYYEPNSWASYGALPCDKFVIKDFNFDGYVDFAIVWDDSGNGSPLYEYYFQNKNGNFLLPETFPLQHGVLAEEFDIENKTILTKTPVGCCSLNINTYQLNANNTWQTTLRQEPFKR